MTWLEWQPTTRQVSAREKPRAETVGQRMAYLARRLV